MNVHELQVFIHQKIPITKSMGLCVRTLSGSRVVLTFPLSKNRNHLGTGFGGSIMSAQAVCCWAWFLTKMKKEKSLRERIELVVKDSQIRFLRPIRGDFQVETTGIPNAEFKKFIKNLHLNGKANLKLVSDVYSQKKLAARFTGHFVVKVK